AWRTFRETTIRYARIRDGQILDPPVSPQLIIPPFNGHLEVAANATDFLVVASQNDPAFSFTAWMLIKESGETLSSLSPCASYLTTWSAVTTISDQPGFQFQTQPLHSKEFYRAVLLLD